MSNFLYQWLDQFNKNVDDALELLTEISKAQDNDPVSDDISNELTMNPAETIFPGLWGGDGNDTLTGGPGADKFVMSHGNDIVTDFRVDEGDTISFLGGRGPFTIYEYDAHVTVTWLYNGQMQIQGATGLDVYRSFSDMDLGMLEATNFDVPA